MSEPAASDRTGLSQPPLSDPGRAGPLDPAVAVGLLQRAQALAAQGDWQLAANTFARVVGNNDPDLHVAALLGLAECRYRMDDEAAAVQCWISATQAPEGPLTWRAWKQLAASRVRTGDLTGAARAYREADRRAPADERAEIASRLGWLAKETGDTRAAGRHFSRSRQGGMLQPSMTWAILAVTAAIGLSSTLLDQEQRWFDWLALTKSGIAAGEYWRLFSVTLVHAGLLHLAFNMYALYIIGPTVEALYGSRRFLLIYLACAAAASMTSYVFSDAEVAVGASGAIFGLFGVLLVADRIHKPALTRQARGLTTQIGVLIGINLIIGFTSAAEHRQRRPHRGAAGGLLAGFHDGAPGRRDGWRPTGRRRRPPVGAAVRGRAPVSARTAALLGLGALTVVICAGIAIGPQRWGL